MTEPTAEQLRAIEIAREMARAGIPIFVCPPNPYKPGKYFFKAAWQKTEADPATLDAWQPGWGVAAVGGGAADFLDMDPRAGGIESQTELKNAGQWPLSFGQQATPSGGTHDVISASGIGKQTGFMPGLDFQAGLPQPDENSDTHRAFVWLAPTVGVSKATGELVPYRWIHEPDLEGLHEWRADDGTTTDASIEGIVSRVLSAQYSARERATTPAPSAPGPAMSGIDERLFGGGGQREVRAFTMEQAEAFVLPHLLALREAPVGLINERGMAATLAIEHFVPAFWTPEQAAAVILDNLSHTAYDENGPSDWTADQQFVARLDGRRPVTNSWKAEKVDHPDVPAAADAVDRLLAEMLHPSEVVKRPAPKHLIKGLLNLDSESWIIGAPGSKKSFVALCMAGHVARGLPWQGMRVTQGRVVMIVAEGAGGLGPRLKAWESRYGAMGDDVFILPRPVQAANLEAWAVLREVCRRIAPALVVLDTQARITVGLEENSAKEMGVYVEAVRSIREATGACVLSVHHTGRQGGDARGSSAIDGAQHSELKVKSEGLLGELISEKQKDMELAAPLPLVFEVVDVGLGEDGEPITSLVLAGDAFSRAAGEALEAPEDLDNVRLAEPGAWTADYVQARARIQRRILQAMRQVGGQVGRTEAAYRKVVEQTWYPGQKRLTEKDWSAAWTAVVGLAVQNPDFPDETVSVVSNRGAKYWLETALPLD